MTARNLARVDNDFEPSAAAIPPDSILSTREVADLLGLNLKTVTNRIWRLRIEPVFNRGGTWRYWTRHQAEQIRRGP